jgi:hypothetical protein
MQTSPVRRSLIPGTSGRYFCGSPGEGSAAAAAAEAEAEAAAAAAAAAD